MFELLAESRALISLGAINVINLLLKSLQLLPDRIEELSQCSRILLAKTTPALRPTAAMLLKCGISGTRRSMPTPTRKVVQTEAGAALT